MFSPKVGDTVRLIKNRAKYDERYLGAIVKVDQVEGREVIRDRSNFGFKTAHGYFWAYFDDAEEYPPKHVRDTKDFRSYVLSAANEAVV